MLPADSRNLVDRKVLNDRRVTNFYDADRLVGAWFANHSDGGDGIVWDAYYLYATAATWADQPQPLLSSGGPVIESSSDLATAFAKLNSAATGALAS